MLFEVPGRAGNGASSSLGEDERANFAFGLLPDFGAGGTIVRLDVIDIDELADFPVLAWRGGLEFFDLVDYQVYIAFCDWGEDEFGTVGANGLLALFTHAIRHDDNDGVTFGSRDTGGGDASLAGGAFDNSKTGPQVASPFCLRDEEV